MAEQRRIFISYRRADNPDFADRIRDWFIRRYGRENVFMDFDSIPPGVRFADHIRTTMQQSDAVIAVIGPRWVELFQERAAKFEDDYVRIELALALELGKPVTPICISGAPVPARGSLPPDLRPLLDFNIAFLDRTNFYERIERIIAAVEAALDTAPDKAVDPPPSADDYFEQAVAIQGTGDFAAAIAAYDQVIRLKPTHSEAFNNRGLMRYYLGDFDGAIADCTRSIELKNPDLHFPYVNRGNAYDNKGDHAAAIADYNEAIRHDPLFADSYYNRGISYHNLGDLDAAIRDYREAIRLKPAFANAYKNLGNALHEQGALSAALANYEKYLELGGGVAGGDQAEVEQAVRELHATVDGWEYKG